MQRAVTAFSSEDISVREEFRWLLLAYIVAVGLWDDTTCRELADRYVRLARDTGALAVLPMALTTRAIVHIFEGELAKAASLNEEVQTIAAATGIHLTYGGALALAAWRGRLAEAEQLADAIASNATSRGEGASLAVNQWMKAVLTTALAGTRRLRAPPSRPPPTIPRRAPGPGGRDGQGTL